MRLYLPVIGVVISNLGYCCSCIYLGKIDESQYSKYGIVLKGRVIKLSERKFERSIFLKVETYFKNFQEKDTIEVISPSQSGECGIFPKIGENWLILACMSENFYRTNLCTRTKNMNPNAGDYNKTELQEDLEFLARKIKK